MNLTGIKCLNLTELGIGEGCKLPVTATILWYFPIIFICLLLVVLLMIKNKKHKGGGDD